MWLTGNDRSSSARQIIYYDKVTHQPFKKELYKAGERLPYSTTTQEWDGIKRLRKSKDANGSETRLTYDLFGRTVETCYADGSVVKKLYARFTSGALATQISLRPAGHDDEIVLGNQKFDRLGRLLATTSGGRVTSMSYDAEWQSSPSTMIAPDGATCHYSNDPLLGGKPLKIKAIRGSEAELEHIFTYNLITTQQLTATGKTGGNETSHTSNIFWPSGRLKSRSQNILGGGELTTNFVWSLGGNMQKTQDVDNITRANDFFSSGRETGLLKQINDGEVKVMLEYDAFSRLKAWSVETDDGKHSLKTTLVLDDFGREISRIINHSNGISCQIDQTWTVNNQIDMRIRKEIGKVVCHEVYTYDNRNRLKSYQASGSALPLDAYGNKITYQEFDFDALNNITCCVTTLQGNEKNTAIYHFDNPKDPCQLTSINNSLIEKYPKQIILQYDAAGRMVVDETGRQLRYDAMGRLLRLDSADGNGCTYGYDPRNWLVWQKVDKTKQLHRLYYRGDKLINEWLTPEGKKQNKNDKRVHLVHATGSCVAQMNNADNNTEVTLTGTDNHQSVVINCAKNETQAYSYTPYGERESRSIPTPGNSKVD